MITSGLNASEQDLQLSAWPLTRNWFVFVAYVVDPATTRIALNNVIVRSHDDIIAREQVNYCYCSSFCC